jgi:hypothetical protein
MGAYIFELLLPTTRPDPQVQIAALWIGTSRSEKMR